MTSPTTISDPAAGAAKNRAPSRNILKRLGVAALILLTCISLIGAMVGIWGKRNFLDTNRFSGRIDAIVADPAVQNAIALQLTNEAMSLLDPKAFFESILPERGQVLAVPLTGVVRQFVNQVVTRVVASPAYQDVLTTVIRNAHRTAVKLLRGENAGVQTNGDSVTITLVPVLNQVLAEINQQLPDVFGKKLVLPAAISASLTASNAAAELSQALGIPLGDHFAEVTIYDGGKLSAVQDGLKLFDKLVVVFALLTIGLVVGLILLSKRRRRTALQLAVAGIFSMVVLRRLLYRVGDDVSDLPKIAANRAAAQAVIFEFLDPLLAAALVFLIVLAVVAFVLWATGAYAWAVKFRHEVEPIVASVGRRASETPAPAWMSAHADAILLAIVAIVLLVLVVFNLSWLGVAVVLVIGALAAGAVYLLTNKPVSIA